MDRELALPDGRNVSVWDGGDPDGEPVVFFHGCPDSRRAAHSGDEAARRAGVRLVAASRPGYSATDVPGPLTGAEHLAVADDTVTLAGLLGIDAFAVLGMSVGGPYALATAARHPERITAAGVVEAPAEVPRLVPPVHRDGLTPDQQAYYRSLAGLDAGRAGEQMRPEFEAWVTALDERDEEAVGCSDGYLRDAAISFRAWPFSVEDVRCPVFAWYGDGDDQYSIRNGQWIAEHTGARLVVREGNGHLATLVEHWDDMLVTLTRKPSTT